MCEIPFSSLSKYNPICTIQVDDNRKTIPLNNFIYTYTMLPFLWVQVLFSPLPRQVWPTGPMFDTYSLNQSHDFYKRF